MKNIAVLLILIVFVSCKSKSVAEENARETSAMVIAEDWSQKYLKAQSTCKEFLKFKKKPAPTQDLAAVVTIKYKEKCSPNENLLKKLKFGWLKKDIILNGLRSTTSPQVFLDYYSEFLQLSASDRTKIEYIERAKLFKKILAKTTDAKVRNNLYWLFPVFYFDNNRAIPQEKIFEAAYELRMQRRFSEARKLYAQIIANNKRKLKSPTKVDALTNISHADDFIRITYRVEEKKQRGITEYTKAVRFFEKFFLKYPKKEFSHFYTDAVVQLARDMWTEGQVVGAQNLLKDAVTKFNGKAQLDHVYWVLGRIEQEKKNYSGAVDYFQKALQEKPEKDFELKMRWLTAWNYKKNHQINNSLKNLEEYGQKSKEYADDANYYKSLFWQSQLLKKMNREDEADKILSDLYEKNPLGYYGQLARLEASPDSYIKSYAPNPSEQTADAVPEKSRKTLEVLLQMSEYDIVADYLATLWHSLEKSDRNKTETRIKFFEWADSAQLYKDNLQFIEILDNDTKKEIIRNHPQLFFPQPYLNTVDKFSKQFSIPREFIYSLMRQESLFDKNARSSADAFGLLQLLPQIAKRYIKSTGVNFENPEELYKPEVIIPLGIAHVASLLKIFKGSMLLAAASYNAGVDPVKNWMDVRFNGDAYEFVEDIPYLETESYTKLVFRNLSYYLQFDSDLSKKEKIKILKSYFNM